MEEAIQCMRSYFIERTEKSSNQKLKLLRPLHLLMLINYHLQYKWTSHMQGDETYFKIMSKNVNIANCSFILLLAHEFTQRAGDY